MHVLTRSHTTFVTALYMNIMSIPIISYRVFQGALDTFTACHQNPFPQWIPTSVVYDLRLYTAGTVVHWLLW